MVLVNEKYTNSKEIGSVVEEQQEQQISDGTDGPSKSTDAALSCQKWLIQVVDWTDIYSIWIYVL